MSYTLTVSGYPGSEDKSHDYNWEDEVPLDLAPLRGHCRHHLQI